MNLHKMPKFYQNIIAENELILLVTTVHQIMVPEIPWKHQIETENYLKICIQRTPLHMWCPSNDKDLKKDIGGGRHK